MIRTRARWVEMSIWHINVQIARKLGYPTHWVKVGQPDEEIKALEAGMVLLNRLMEQQLRIEEAVR